MTNNKINEYSLTAGQSALWFLHQLTPDSPVYNICRAVDINFDLDLDIFKRAIECLAERHDALRTVFRLKENQPVQVVNSEINVDFSITDISGVEDKKIDEILYSNAIMPFDLERGPLFRVSIFTINPQKHIVLFNFHHIISDLWSLAILIKEVGTVYDAIIANKKPNLFSTDFTYENHVNEELDFLNSSDTKKMLDFWSAQLAGELPVLKLLNRHPKKITNGFIGSSVSLNLGEEQTFKLKEFAKGKRVSVYSTLLASFHVLLNRYSGNEDIIIGTSKSGRRKNSIFTVGYFVNSVPIRAKINGEMRFDEFLSIEHATVAETSRNDRYPFSLLVEKLQPVRDNDQTPVFQTFFTMQKTTKMVDGDGLAYLSIGETGGFMQWGAIPTVSRGLNQRIVPFDLTMLVAQTKDDILVSIQFNNEMFSHDYIRQMIKCYESLLLDIVDNPEKKIKNLNIYPKDNVKAPAHALSSGSPTRSAENSFIEVFQSQVDLEPDKIAIMYNDENISYRELNQKANQLARKLVSLGVVPEKNVGVYLKRTPNILISLLAIMKAGGVYVPMDYSNPVDRLEYMVSDSKLNLLIVDELVRSDYLDDEIIQINLNGDFQFDDSLNLENPTPKMSNKNNAYVIYTSGTTGFPKGVQISHENINAHIEAIKSEFKISKNDRILQFSSIGFDASLEQIFLAFSSGSTLVLRSDELWSASEFIEKIQKYKLTVINIPPAYWVQLVKELDLTSLDTIKQYVRLIIVGGDVIPFDILSSWQNAGMGSVRLINAYGPTETTITSTTFDVPTDFCSSASTHNVPIGKQVEGKSIFILDNYGNLLPNGVIGEIYIGGSTISSGYINKPDVTAQYFVPNPFSELPGDRLYRTGDLASYAENGALNFWGRRDNQVKIRGMRIEIEEIESLLLRHQDISNIAVVVDIINKEEKRLVAYYVTKSKDSIHQLEFKDYLSYKIPDYMIPSIFIQLEEMPVTAIGKIDRKALPKPDNLYNELITTYAGPRTSVEEKISSIVAEVLDLEKVGIYDNFFELGGHSILAIQFVSKVKKEFGVNLPLGYIFEYPNVALLSSEIVKLITQTFEDDNLEGLLNLVE